MTPCLEIIVLTLFPEMFKGVLSESILKRAIADGQLSVRLVNFREFANDKHKTVDDYPFGGGAGMLRNPHRCLKPSDTSNQNPASWLSV